MLLHAIVGSCDPFSETNVGKLACSLARWKHRKADRAQDGWYSIAALAARWGLSEETVSRRLLRYKDTPGWKDFGTPADLKTHKRAYRVIRISPTLLARIEGSR